jgi:hypothetical protein
MIKVGKSEFYAEIWNINERRHQLHEVISFRDEFSCE